jgi:hypothetical protein
LWNDIALFCLTPVLKIALEILQKNLSFLSYKNHTVHISFEHRTFIKIAETTIVGKNENLRENDDVFFQI